jgi:hypothetical protein
VKGGKKMEIDKLYRVKHVILLQVVRDILIENGLTTHEEFREKFLNKLEQSGLSDEDKKEIKELI